MIWSAAGWLALGTLGCQSPVMGGDGFDSAPADPAAALPPGTGPSLVGEHQAAVPSDPGRIVAELALDPCDEPDYAGEEWSTRETSHFVFHYFDGTAASRDIEEIAASREEAYTEIRDLLGIRHEPRIDVYLSPNRVAALAHGREPGAAFPGSDRYEVIYTGDPGSSEATQYQHELVHVLAYYLGPLGRGHLPFVAEGLAEYLDGSERDMHHAYAMQLVSEPADRVRLAELGESDVWGGDPARAGSFVAHLAERYGLGVVLHVLRDTASHWVNDCYRHRAVGCIDSPAAVAAVLDGALRTGVGRSWAEVRSEWEERVQEAVEGAGEQLAGADREQVELLLRVMDAAIATDDVDAYRSTMEGHYCDAGGEAERMETAARVVQSYDLTESHLVALYPTGTESFPAARAMVERIDGHGVVQSLELTLELFPVGWRVTAGPDWI